MKQVFFIVFFSVVFGGTIVLMKQDTLPAAAEKWVKAMKKNPEDIMTFVESR